MYNIYKFLFLVVVTRDGGDVLSHESGFEGPN
jgi:hypothetical protein